MNTGHCIFHRLAVVFIGFFLVVGTALADVPWQNAETIRAETARVTRLLYRPVSTARDADLAAVLATIRSAWNDGLADAYGPDASLVGSEIDALGDAIATNDGEAAARARSLIWTGLLKGAMDHTLAALDAVARHGSDRRIVLVGEEDIAISFSGPFGFYAEAGERISVHPLMAVSFARSEGLYYPLDGLTLAPGVRTGTSNTALGGDVSIVPEPGGGVWLLIVDKRHLMRFVTELAG